MSKSHSMIAVALLATLASTPAVADTKQDQLDLVAREMSAASSSQSYPKRLRDHSAACLQAIEDALAAGATLDEDVEVPDSDVPGARQIKNPHGHWIYVSSLREGKAYCAALAAQPDVQVLKEALAEADIWIGKGSRVVVDQRAKKGFDDQARAEAETMTRKVEACQAAVDHAVSVGVAATVSFKLKNAGTVTVADAGTLVCDRLATGAAEILAIEDEKLEERLAPYKAALAGDKLTTWLDRHMLFVTVYGKGGTELDTPAALVKASKWFVVLTWDDEIGRRHWTVRAYTFKKNKLKSTKERTGCCDWPPSKAFK